jgi:hypothetical protein
MTFTEAKELYTAARWMKDDLPDGMWEDMKEVAEGYKESDKTDEDKEYFIEGVESVMEDWGFPITA